MIASPVPGFPLVRQTFEAAPSIATNRDFAPSSPEAKAVLAEVRKLANLEQNWDGEGGLPVSRIAESASVSWLLFGLQLGMVARVMPLGDGGLLAEWRYRNRLLQIEWSSNGTGDFDVAIDHELVIEEALPNEPRSLFTLFLDETRTALLGR